MASWLSLATFAAGCTSRGPELHEIKTKYPVVVYKGPKQPFEVKLQPARPPGWVALESISKPAVTAIRVSEDWAFFDHKGIDPQQIREAIEEDLERGTFARGASTITQQVVKNVFLSQERSMVRKIREIWLATKIEKMITKRKILEIYLNIAEMGEGIFGIGAAAQFYFQKSPSALSAKEGAFLAMLLPSPKRYSQSFRQKALSPYARKTVSSILDKLVRAKAISEEERELARTTPLSFEKGASEKADSSDKGAVEQLLEETDEELQEPEE